MNKEPLPHLLNWHSHPNSNWHDCLIRSLWHSENKGWSESGAGKSIGLFFFNPSLRTRTSMEQAAMEIGAKVTSLTFDGGLWGIEWGENIMEGTAAEHIEEAIAVLSRYYQALGVRVFAAKENHEDDILDKRIKQIASAASVPVLNLESAMFHPCQALADASVLARHFDSDLPGKGRKFVLQWCYHTRALPMAVPNSALLMATRLGFDVVVSRPDGFALEPSIMDLARVAATQSGGSLTESNDRLESAKDAHVIYAKAWAGNALYTDRAEEESTRLSLKPWRVTSELMSKTNSGQFMHCLPVRRGVVVDTEVLKGENSLHLDQAEFRLHAQKAILEQMWSLA